MGEGKLESHFKEQEGDADLGQKLHLVCGADQSESAGTHQDSGHQETHQGWSRQPVCQRHDGNRDADEQRQVDQQPCFGHGFFSLSRERGENRRPLLPESPIKIEPDDGVNPPPERDPLVDRPPLPLIVLRQRPRRPEERLHLNRIGRRRR